jgi:hypothetical protein
MSYTWGERPNGYRTTTNPLTDIVGYKLTGAFTFAEVRSLAALLSPMLRATGYGNLYRNNIEASEIGFGVWDVDCHYGAWQRKEPVAGDMGWSFVTTGGTKHITQSLSTAAQYVPAGKTVADFKGAIGVGQDSVEGADIPAKSFKWTEQWKLPLGNYSWAYAQVLSRLTPCLNNAPFRGFPKSEVLFEGAEGGLSVKDSQILELTYHFSQQTSLNGLTVGDITVTTVAGWQMMWVHYKKSVDTDSNQAIAAPDQVNVENVISDGDLSLLGIGVGLPVPFGLGTSGG